MVAQLSSSNSVVADWPGRGIVMEAGVQVPADGTAGYAPGAIFCLLLGSAPGHYLNRGTLASAQFRNVTFDLSGYASGNAEITLRDNVNDALSFVIEGGGKALARFKTSDGAESLQIDNLGLPIGVPAIPGVLLNLEGPQTASVGYVTQIRFWNDSGQEMVTGANGDEMSLIRDDASVFTHNHNTNLVAHIILNQSACESETSHTCQVCACLYIGGQHLLTNVTVVNGPYGIFVDAGVNRFDDGIISGGAAALNAAAIIQSDSTTKGWLPPRMTTAQRDAISSPPAGLVIFNTTTNKLNVRGASAWEGVTSS